MSKAACRKLSAPGFDSPQLHVEYIIGKYAVVKLGIYRDRCGKVVQHDKKTNEVVLELIPNKERQRFLREELIID